MTSKLVAYLLQSTALSSVMPHLAPLPNRMPQPTVVELAIKEPSHG